MTNVGVIGLGVIGKPIAGRLLKAGHRVFVFDVRAEPVAELKATGADACASPADVAGSSDIVISLVHDAAQTDDVVFGARGVAGALKQGAIFATGSTLGPVPVQKIAKALAERGCDTLDIPITGGYIAAAEGKLALMVGAEETVLARALPVLYTFASVITHCGGVGAGQSAKLAHQLVLTMNVLALLEGLALGTAGGVKADVLKQVLKDGLANSTALQVWHDLGPRWKGMMKPAVPGEPLPNLRKDLHTALELAQELGLDLPVGAYASRIADSGKAAGHDNPAL
jgi:2-hydroxy-3-oxopropionate reductase